MKKSSPEKTVALLIVIVCLVIGLSTASVSLWGGKSEQSQPPAALVMDPAMTVGQFGQTNDLPNKTLKEIFGLQSLADLNRKLGEFGSPDEVNARVKKKMALVVEHASKNWIKIPVKFGLWFIFLFSVYFAFRKRPMTAGARKWLLAAAVGIFGVVMGSDPGPMGTVKDAIHLYATSGAIFPPRMIALTVFLIMVLLANKYICAWGCQAGTLQDLVFRINQNDKQKAVIGKQIKLPFALTNSIRLVFFVAVILAALLWGLDIIDPVDPFKMYKPAHLGLIGGVFMGLLQLAGLFVYRPWCHLFCPFGLIGWVVEKISRVRISVDYETCIACRKCAGACPSTVMEAILTREKKTIPDCFACYTCRDICPTGSIQFSKRKRTLPPAGHFNAKSKNA
jgi:polyferredoxin